MLRTTATTLTGWMTLILTLSAATAWAGPLTGSAALQLAPAMLGQAMPNTDSLKRAQAAELVARARDAMKANQLDVADKLIVQAEALGVNYSPLALEDTPQKARRDLDRQRTALADGVRKPSGLFQPSLPKKAPASDPFAGRVVGSILPEQPQITPLPKVEPNTVPSLARDELDAGAPFGRQISTLPDAGQNTLPPALARLPAAAAAPANGAAQVGRDLLRAARRALAVGDVRRAASFVAQARAQSINFDPLDDTPDKVEAAIRRYNDVTSQASNSEAYRRSYARMLMEQAEVLLRSGDFQEAEALATQADRQRLTYGPLETKPQELLTRIANLRRQAGATASTGETEARFAPGAATAPVAPDAANPIGAATVGDDMATRQQAVAFARQAREALRAGQYTWAENLAQRAERMHLPDAAFAPEDRPGRILYEIHQMRQTGGAVAASAVMPASGDSSTDRAAARAFYDAAADTTRNMPASAVMPANGMQQTQYLPGQTPTPAMRDMSGAAPESESIGMAMFRQGEEALRNRQPERAYQFYMQAANYSRELDPSTQQQLQDRLQLLAPAGHSRTAADASPVDEATAKQQALVRQVQSELAHQEANARSLRDSDPKQSLKVLQDARSVVEASGLDSSYREQLLRRVDRSIADTQQYLEQNRSRIELDERNNQVRQDIDRDRQVKLDVQEKYALLVNQFNQLMDDQRYPEAEMVAKQAAELDPQNPVSQQLLWQSKFVARFMRNREVASDSEQNFITAMGNVDSAAIPFDDNNPFQYGNAKQWQELTGIRAKTLAQLGRNRSERDLEIESRLRTQVSLQFESAPLSKVLEYLAKLAEVNLVIDSVGLSQEGVSSDTPVSINVQNEIMLKSALNLILQPLHLSYVIQDEVLKISSEQARDGQVYPVTYNVADLVMPIPNFMPNPQTGLSAAYKDAMTNAGMGGANPWGGGNAPLAVLASKNGDRASGMINPAVLAQVGGPTQGGLASALSGGTGGGFGPGGLGGGTAADFDSLINLIKSTIAPASWDEVGGKGSIEPFETNLSIVISQTQQVHEQIVDLLKQLRRLQDLQVTIEVRFITLNDNFFERIGVDFDFDIDDNVDSRGKIFGSIITPGNPEEGLEPLRNVLDRDDDQNKNMTVGLSQPGPNGFSADLDIPFSQDSFSLAVPQFGGFDASAGASIGFAILSDIEAFFFINAAQGDRRSNLLQAPKVTLFNGQVASVNDTSQSPFVISVIPVVGDFAAAQQPVIVVLSEGTHLTVQAVVSDDKRYVRLTILPFFSKIGDDVPTFQFTGSRTTTTDTSADGWVNPDDDTDTRRETNSSATTTTASGTSVQLPTFSSISVQTTVSVPDGGTVLLGGIKRLSEGRNEFGVPILNKIPYLSRLFKNVGIGRETQSLMMMVTPRIIIQEEEEQKLGFTPPE